MKKILILIFIISISYGQVLDRSEEGLVPTKKFNIKITNLAANEAISPIIILNKNESNFFGLAG
jgi:hypothetical protein